MIYLYYVVAYVVWFITIKCWQEQGVIGYDPEQPDSHVVKFDVIMMLIAALIGLSWILVIPLAILLGEKK